MEGSLQLREEKGLSRERLKELGRREGQTDDLIFKEKFFCFLNAWKGTTWLI